MKAPRKATPPPATADATEDAFEGRDRQGTAAVTALEA